MTIISPSLLACDFLNIETELNNFKDQKNIWFHLDIMDGHFVPNLTFGHSIIEKISKKTDIPLDAHLMVTNPLFLIETFKNYNIHNLTIHIEAVDNPVEVLKIAKKYYPSVGISIKPATKTEVLTSEILDLVDLVLIMSVEPGFGGQKFMPESINKIKELASRPEKFQIQVDGGVSDKNSKKLINAGATNLVAGSYIFKNKPSEYSTSIESLRFK